MNPPTPTLIDIIGNYILLGAGVAAVLFLLAYGLGSNWRSTPGGRSIFYFVTGLAAVFVYSIVGRFIGGDYLFRDVLRALVYSYVLIMTTRLLVNLLRTQLGGNHPRRLLTAAQARIFRTRRRMARKEARLQKRKRKLEGEGRRATKKEQVSGRLPLQDRETAAR